MYPNPLTQETSQDTGFLGKLDDGPAYEEYNTQILNTIQDLTATGKAHNTIKSVFYALRRINRETDLMNTEAVKTTIRPPTIIKNTNNKLKTNITTFAHNRTPNSERKADLKRAPVHKPMKL